MRVGQRIPRWQFVALCADSNHRILRFGLKGKAKLGKTLETKL